MLLRSFALCAMFVRVSLLVLSLMRSGLFNAEFDRRLLRLYDAIITVFFERKEANLFPALFSVFSYLYSGRKARLKSNPNYEL